MEFTVKLLASSDSAGAEGRAAIGSPFGGAAERSEAERACRCQRGLSMKTTTVVKNFRMLETARELRRRLTPQEKKLWYDFLRKYPVKFYKQRIIESFVVDFYCADARLVIELDGSQHYTEQGCAYDEERSAILNGYDLKVLRFDNLEIDQQFEVVCEVIDHEVKCRTR